MVQWAGHQRNHTISLQKSDVDSYLQLFHVHYHEPINGSFWYAYFIAGNMVLVEKQVTNHLELAPIEWQPSNRLHIAAGSRQWMHWIWQDTVCMYIMLSRLMRGAMREAEIRRVKTNRICCAMSLFSSTSKFCCTVHSALWFTLGEEPNSRRYWWTWVNTTSTPRIHIQGYHCWYSAAAVVLLLQNPCTKWISVNFQGKEVCVNSLLTAHFSQNEQTALSAVSVLLAGAAQDMRTPHRG